MIAKRYNFLLYLRVLLDLITINFCFILAYYFRFKVLPDYSTSNQYLSLHILVNLIWVLSFGLFVYKTKFTLDLLGTRLRDLTIGIIIFAFFYFTFIVFMRRYEYSRAFHIYFIILILIGSIINNFMIWLIFAYLAQTGKFKKNILLIQNGKHSDYYLAKIKEKSYLYNIVGYFDLEEKEIILSKRKYPGDINGFEKAILSLEESDQKIDEIIIIYRSDKEDIINELVKVSENNCIFVKFIPFDFSPTITRRIQIEFIDSMPIIGFRNEVLSYLHNKFLKRIFDIVFSLAILFTVFPILYIVIGIGIKLSSRGPILFKQYRKGYRGEAFVCYKFRTMKLTDKSMERIQAKRDDPRKFKFGDFLRRTNLDELPQFINVLRGEMSVVGPRPHMIEHDEMYSRIIDNYNVRYFAKPGLTGWAQVNGYRGATEDPELMRKRVEHDIWYLENWTFSLDIKIILLTLLKMIRGDPNAY